MPNAIKKLDIVKTAKKDQAAFQSLHANSNALHLHQVTNATGLLSQNQSVNNKNQEEWTKTNAKNNAINHNSKNATTRITPVITVKEARTQNVSTQPLSVKPKRPPEDARSINLMDSTDKSKLT